MQIKMCLVSVVVLILSFSINCFAERLALVVTSPSFDSVESVFGHSFLVLYKDEFPELDSRVISFVANTKNQTKNIKYLLKGLAGDFETEIKVEPFYQKYFQYALVENRSLYFYELDISKLKIELLQRNVLNLKLKNYKFITQNCSNSLLDFLKSLDYETNHSKKFYITPNETQKLISKYTINSFIIRNPRINLKDDKTLEVLNFYARSGKYADNLAETNKDRTATVEPKVDIYLRKNLSDQKIFFDASKENLRFKYSPIYRDYIDVNFSELNLNKVELASIEILSESNEYKINQLTLVNLEKNSFHKILPINYGFAIYAQSPDFADELKMKFSINVGTAIALFSNKVPLFADIKMVTTEGDNSTTTVRLRGFISDSNNIKQYLEFSKDITPKEPHKLLYEFNVLLNQENNIGLSYNSDEILSLRYRHSF